MFMGYDRIIKSLCKYDKLQFVNAPIPVINVGVLIFSTLILFDKICWSHRTMMLSVGYWFKIFQPYSH